MDPDRQRRTVFLRNAAPQLELVEGLRRGSVEGGDFGAVWAAPPEAPLDTARDGDRVALLFGDALEGDARLDAESLLSGAGALCRRACDGFYAALIYDGDGGVVAGVDHLGLFPLFYASSVGEGVVVVGSSPELFHLHPLFPQRACPMGLIGLLLAHGTVGGRTLLEGVRRLSVGHVLAHTRKHGSTEEHEFEIETSVDLEELDFDAHLERLDGRWRATLDRHVPMDTPVGLLLSGGRDSRLIAGYLADLGRDVRAVTLGRERDYDAGCAAAVARTLAFDHVRVDVPEDRLAEWAPLQVRWEHLSSGFSNVHTWAAVPSMRNLASHCVSGYLREVREVPLGSGGFEGWIDGPHGHGIAPSRLRALLRREVRGLVDEVVDELRAAWDRSSADPDDRAWRFLLRHGWRAHPGGVMWRFSLGSWPVLPLLDREMLRLMASIPPPTLANRRAQDALLRRRFPRLARLPLDRNGHDTIPLEATRLRRIANPFLVRFRRARTRLGPRLADRRYYHRVYDLETDGWRAVRERAEPGRPALARVFDPRALDRLLPPPPEPLGLEHPIRDGFVPKLVLGLMLWAVDHPL